MRPIPPEAVRQFGAFTTAQAREGGWTDSALRHALRTGALERLRTGVYARALETSGVRRVDAVERLARASAAVSLTCPRVPISHAGSAAVMRLPLVGTGDHVCVTTPRGMRDDIPGVHLHHGRIPPGDLYRADRILVTSPARTVVDLGRENGADAAIAAADAALRRRLVSMTGLEAALSWCAGWPGVRAAAAAVGLADPRAESPLESVSRLRIHDAQLPEPEAQPRILDATGRFVGRVDFYWDEFGVVGEADGLLKYDELGSLREEKLRQECLERCGLIAVRWGWSDLTDFGPVAVRLNAAFARGSRPDRAPRHWIVRSTAA